MRPTLLLVLLVMTAASPAAAQSCATLGGGLDCGAAPGKPAAKQPLPPRPGRNAGSDAESHGYSETTVSNHGASTTLNNKVIDSHGIVEFGFSGSTRTPCRLPGYGSPCQ